MKSGRHSCQILMKLEYARPIFEKFLNIKFHKPVPVAARCKAWVYGRSPAETVGSNPTGGMDVCLL